MQTNFLSGGSFFLSVEPGKLHILLWIFLFLWYSIEAYKSEVT